MKGLVIKNTGSWYTVLMDDGQLVPCKVKGNFRLKGIRSTNPVAVGDRVEVVCDVREAKREVQGAKEGGTEAFGWITDIEDRRNYIIRKSSNLSKQSHILAANVDQVFLIVTVNYPETSTVFIDRFLASAEAYRVPVVLVFNKRDLLSEEELHYQDMMMQLYDTIGYHCVSVSATTGYGIDELHRLMQNKITLLSGHSGVGKSTLINRLLPGSDLRTAEISDAHNTGMHTTTFSEMIPLSSCSGENDSVPSCLGGVMGGSGWLIDTPGIKGFGTFDIEPEELTSYFKDIFHFSKDCRFSNCTHTHEPGCAVLKAVEDHYIAASRYQSYLSMLQDKEENKYREAY